MMRLGVFALFLGIPVAVSAQECAEIEDNAERLACYDAENTSSVSVPDEASAPSPPDTTASQPPEGTSAGSSTPVAAPDPDSFGKEEPLDTSKEYIEATIVEIKKSGLVYYLRLDNGQVWREVEDSTLRFREGRKVTITEGILNSFDLQMEGQNKIAKVRRIR